MFLNATTGLWEAWPYGQFYESTTMVCRDWGSSCTNLCAYREECYVCGGGEYFSLKTMNWSSTWDLTSSFVHTYSLLNGTDIEFWRPNIFYVNPESTKVMELGTIKYPIRNINIVLNEVHNVYANTNSTVHI